MSLSSSRRRLALRAAVATAALAGAVLAPTATAFANTAPQTDKPAATAPEGTLIRTDKLQGGLTAEVHRHGDTNTYYTAVVLKGDKQLGTLTAGTGHAAEDRRVFEDVEVILTGEGVVTSFSNGGGDQGPVTPAGVLVHKDKLEGGLIAQVYRFGEKDKKDTFYSATIYSGGKVLGSLTAGHGHKNKETELFGDISVTLYSDGRITSVNDKGSPGQGPETPVNCVATLDASIGAGVGARLSIAPDGPSVTFRSEGSGATLPEKLNRESPKLPASAGYIAEILHPDSHAPKLRTKMEGGDAPAAVRDFPKLPKGCTFLYGNAPEAGNGNNSSNNGTAQTTVVPKGSVAAGAELEQSGDTTLVTVGTAAAALSAAGIGFVVLRRRAAVTGR